LKSASIFFSKVMRELTPAQREALARLGIRTERQLASRAESCPDFVQQIADARLYTGIVAAAAAALYGRSTRARIGWYERFWPIVAVLLVVGLISAAVWCDLRYTYNTGPIVRVARAGGLEPFHLIIRSDLRADKTPPDPKSVQAIEQAVGHYTREYVAANQVLDRKKLNAGPPLSAELNGRFIIRLKVVSTDLFSAMDPPFQAQLMASPRERGTAALLVGDVFVLDLQQLGDGMSVVLAIPSPAESSLASYAARSDFYLLATSR
jgi:hypothetical protein